MGIGNEAQEVYNVVKIKLETINKKPDNILLLGFFYRAGDEVRTRDIQLGRLTLYQLSYSRNYSDIDIFSECKYTVIYYNLPNFLILFLLRFLQIKVNTYKSISFFLTIFLLIKVKTNV